MSEPRLDPASKDEAPRRSGRRALIAAVAFIAVAALIVFVCVPLFGALFDRPVKIPAPDPNFPSYAAQQPNWVDCGDGVLCADVFAPLDWATASIRDGSDSAAERITLRLAKHPAGGGDPIGTLFVNIGGPGASTVDAVTGWVDGLVSPDVLEAYDVIGWDPRGVGASSAVSCLDDAELDDYLYGSGDPEEDGEQLAFGSDAWIEEGLAVNAEFGAACEERTGALLGHVDTLSTVQDLDMLRGIVGDAELNYLGYSYGTRIGALYADRFPERSGRLVLDGAMDPAADIDEISRQQVIGIEGALRAYVADCLGRSGCPLSGTVDEGMHRIGRMLDQAEKDPIRAGDGRLLYGGTLFTALTAPLYSQQSWPELDKLIEGVAAGSAEQAFRLADGYNDRVDGVYRTNTMEAFIAINCLDYPRLAKLDFDAMRASAAETERLAPITGRYQAFSDVGCANWPVPAVDVTGTVEGAGAEPILVIGTTGDPATPFRWAQSLAKQLESGVLVTFAGEGHTAYGASQCVDRIVDDYLLDGDVPQEADARCTV